MWKPRTFYAQQNHRFVPLSREQQAVALEEVNTFGVFDLTADLCRQVRDKADALNRSGGVLVEVQKVVRVCEKILVKVKGPLGNVLWACGQLATAATRCPQVYNSGMLPETVKETERLTIQNTNQPLFDKLLRDEAEFAAAKGKGTTVILITGARGYW